MPNLMATLLALLLCPPARSMGLRQPLLRSPVERVLRSDGGPGLVLGRAMPVRDARSSPRRDWCRTATLVQRVREPGCRTAILRNRYCYGQCKSFYVPREYVGPNNGSSSGAFESCAACKPVKFRTVKVTLVCPGQVPPVRKKALQRVHRCRCLAATATR